MSSKPAYDLILVATFFRRIANYLSIIKFLSPRHRIGLYQVPMPESAIKNRSAHELFLRRCKELGAELIGGSQKVEARLAIFPQDEYPEAAYADIASRLTYREALGMLTLAWPGLRDDFVYRLRIRKLLVVHRRFMEFLLRERLKPDAYAGLELIEVGLPFQKYPVFEDLGIDYFIAMPTPFSFSKELDKIDYLDTLERLLEQIGPEARIVHKPHNALDYDHFSGKAYLRAARALRALPHAFVRRCFGRLIGSGGRLGAHLQKTFVAYLYERILARVVPFEKLTPDHSFSIEAFMPSIRRGVIGGLSNTIWGSLFYRIPYFNCVDIARQERKSWGAPSKRDPSRFLDLNLRFFHVPYCRGDLSFDPALFDIVDDGPRNGDLIQAVENAIREAA
jgi:hypothetical protein